MPTLHTTAAATGPSPAATPSVFSGTDICQTAGLTLRAGAVHPVYDQDLWDLSGLADAPRDMIAYEKQWDFSVIDNPRWRPVIKDLLLALLAPHDERVRVLPAAFRTVRSPRTCHLYLRRATTWCNWLTAHQVTTLGEVTQAHCDAFLEQQSWSQTTTASRGGGWPRERPRP